MTRRSVKESGFDRAVRCIEHWPKARQGIAALRRKGIRSLPDLRRKLPTLPVSLRKIAVWLLVHAPERSALPILIDLLWDPGREVSLGAANGLRHCRHERAAQAAARALRHGSPVHVREMGAYALGGLTNEDVLDVLLGTARNVHEDLKVRIQAVRGVEYQIEYHYDCPAILRHITIALKELARDSSREVRDAVESTILSACLQGTAAKAIQMVYSSAEDAGIPHEGVDPAFDKAVALLCSRGTTPKSRAAARRDVAVLHDHGIVSFDTLVERFDLLRDAPYYTAFGLLEHAPKPIAGPRLLELMTGNNESLAHQAAFTLAHVGGKRVRRAVTQLLVESKRVQRRWLAAFCLRHMADPETLGALMAAATRAGEAVRVRAEAIEAIGVIGDSMDRRSNDFKKASGLLLGLLRDRSPQIRFWTCYSLASMNVTEAIPALRRLAKRDKGVCPGWRPVRQEAAMAAIAIEFGGWPQDEREVFYEYH